MPVLFAVLCLLLLAVAPARAETAAERFDRLLAEADAATWFAQNDQGDLATFDQGLALLSQAKSLLLTLPEGPERDERAAAALALEQDLRWQREVFHDQLGAIFPLIRFYGTSALLDDSVFGSHELFDDPRDRAIDQALGGLLALPFTGLPQRPQLDVVFASVPRDAEPERAALDVFNRSPRYFVHNEREVVTALQPFDPGGTLSQEAVSGDLDEETAALLRATFGVERLLAVTLRRQEALPGERFYIAEGRVFSAVEPQEGPIDRALVMGFGRDRTGWIWPLAGLNLLFWGLAVALHQRIRGGRLEAGELLLPSIGFLLGRVAPWGLLPLLSQIKPDIHTLAAVTFWWPALAGAVLILAPVGLLSSVGRRLPVVAPFLAWARGLESLALAAAAGLAAWLATPLLLLREAPGLASLAVAVPGLLITAWLFARLLKGERGAALAAPLLALAMGLALATARLDWIAGGTALALAALVLQRQRAPAAKAAADTALPARLAGFCPLGIPDLLREKTAGFDGGQVAWVALTGPAGAGKTVQVNAYLGDLARRDGPPLVLLEGACQPLADGGAVPFAPLQQALAQHLKLDLAQLNQPAGEAAQGLYDLLLGPLAPLLNGDVGLGASERDLFAFIARALRQEAQRARVVLLVDDAQWLDQATAGLLRHLHQALPPEAPGSLLVLLVGRRESGAEAFEALLPLFAEVTLRALTVEQQQALLVEGYRLAPTSADWVVDWLGGRQGQTCTSGALVEVVEQLLRAGALVDGDEGLVFAAGFDREAPPIAPSAVEEVRRALTLLPQAQDTLAVAACLGRRFEASLVAAALGHARQPVLKELAQLERQTNLLRDVLEEDDIFEFRSQRALDAVRQVLDLKLRGPDASEVPQATRELNAQVARALASRSEGARGESLADLLRQATHWYGAGRSYADEAVAANLEAARRLAGLLRFDEAETFRRQAAAYAALNGRGAAVEALGLWLAAERAHVTGLGARPAAEAGLAFLANPPLTEAPGGDAADERLRLAVARACYEAGRDGGPSLAAEAERLGLAAAERAADPLLRAQGLHFAGLALRFDPDPARVAEGRRRLGEALALAESAEPGPASEAQTAQIANSLALAELAAGQAAAAETLFRRSLELKQRAAIPDRPGLARSYGGLGYLLLERGERLDEAVDYFQRDIALAEEIGDRAGGSKARLWLGQALARLGHAAEAEAAFQAVVAEAVTPGDRASALAGLLSLAAARGDRAAFLALAATLAPPLPRESRGLLAAALAWPEAAGDAAVAALLASLEGETP